MFDSHQADVGFNAAAELIVKSSFILFVYYYL